MLLGKGPVRLFRGRKQTRDEGFEWAESYLRKQNIAAMVIV